MKSIFFTITIFLGVLCPIIGNGQTQKAEAQTLRASGKSFKHIPRQTYQFKNDSLCEPSIYRTINGCCNNLDNPEWGGSDMPLRRALPAAYGLPDTNNDLAGQDRKSPREISNLVSNQPSLIPSATNLSALVFTWGQFLDHDVDLTPETHEEPAMIALPSNEPLFTAEIPFSRSVSVEGTGVTSPRQHPNIITPWIDASNVYGSEDTRATWLRLLKDGKLKTSANNMLPFNSNDAEFSTVVSIDAPSMAGDDEGTVPMFVAGDVRANEQPGLTAMHTIFVREHNRICDELLAQGMTDDEEIYQIARKHVGAIIQNITYNEFLPALGINLSAYSGYNSTIQPDISSIFSTAAYRVGHTMVIDGIPLIDENCDPINGGYLSLIDGFFNPDAIIDNGIESVLKGLASAPQQEIDVKVINNLRNFLFGEPGSPNVFGLDLVSLNIQRGRDHGLPDYNTIRESFTGVAATSFADITSDPELQAALEEAYDGDINNIDAWVGMLSEDKEPNSNLGKTLIGVLGGQFLRLREGDAFFFLNDSYFSQAELDEISNTTLADIIERNTDLSGLAANVFFADQCSSCPTAGTPCDDNNGTTINDIADGYCGCYGEPITNGLSTCEINDPLLELPWLQNVINLTMSGLGCDCDYEIAYSCYNNAGIFIVGPGPNSICADVPTNVFDAEGNLICTGGGITGGDCFFNFPDLFDEATLIDIVWECSNDCDNIIDPVQELTWLSDLIDGNDCYNSVYGFDYLGQQVYYVAAEPGCSAIDIPSTLYTCTGDILCLDGGNTIPTAQCGPDVLDALIPTNMIWERTTIDTTAAIVSARVFLQGPLQNPATSSVMMMDDHLFSLASMPELEPFTLLNSIQHYGDGGGEVISLDALSNTGPDGIIDWIMVELRDPNQPEIILSTRSALLQRDGDIVDLDGVSPVQFAQMISGDYYVSICHRNHLGVMTAEPVNINANTSLIDFTSTQTATWGTHAQVELVQGAMALWAGDTNKDRQIVYQGNNNDLNTCFFEVLFDPGNTLTATNYVSNGYQIGDINMDNRTIYQGPQNEANIVFFNIVSHPLNTTFSSNFVIVEQVP